MRVRKRKLPSIYVAPHCAARRVTMAAVGQICRRLPGPLGRDIRANGPPLRALSRGQLNPSSAGLVEFEVAAEDALLIERDSARAGEVGGDPGQARDTIDQINQQRGPLES